MVKVLQLANKARLTDSETRKHVTARVMSTNDQAILAEESSTCADVLLNGTHNGHNIHQAGHSDILKNAFDKNSASSPTESSNASTTFTHETSAHSKGNIGVKNELAIKRKGINRILQNGKIYNAERNGRRQTSPAIACTAVTPKKLTATRATKRISRTKKPKKSSNLQRSNIIPLSNEVDSATKSRRLQQVRIRYKIVLNQHSSMNK